MGLLSESLENSIIKDYFLSKHATDESSAITVSPKDIDEFIDSIDLNTVYFLQKTSEGKFYLNKSAIKTEKKKMIIFMIVVFLIAMSGHISVWLYNLFL